jgi:hypothetical protein
MNKQQIAQLLTIASGFDKRQVDSVTVEAWALVPGVRDADYDDAVAAVIAHVTGPERKEYLTVGHVVAATQQSSRQTKELIAADVRSAKARRMIGSDWPENRPVTSEVRHRLAVVRDAARENALNNPPELEGSWTL